MSQSNVLPCILH